MAITKSAKIQAEIEKVKAKIVEQQTRLKELEQKKLEVENSEIVDIVRGMSVSLEELPLEVYRQFSPVFDADVYPAIDLLTCVSQRKLTGGPAPEAVRATIDATRKKLEA